MGVARSRQARISPCSNGGESRRHVHCHLGARRKVQGEREPRVHRGAPDLVAAVRGHGALVLRLCASCARMAQRPPRRGVVVLQVKLAELSEGAILHNLRMRYVANDIYVRAWYW